MGWYKIYIIDENISIDVNGEQEIWKLIKSGDDLKWVNINFPDEKIGINDLDSKIINALIEKTYESHSDYVRIDLWSTSAQRRIKEFEKMKMPDTWTCGNSGTCRNFGTSRTTLT